jgi:hypothetical protein
MQLGRGWRTVVCVASGPSLTDEQCAIAAEARRDGRCRVVVVNDNWRKIPDADVLYACDGRWWRRYVDEVRASGFAGELWTQDRAAAEKLLLNHVAGEPGGKSAFRESIPRGGSSGLQAMALAHLFGATKIVLIGYDMQRGPNGEKHWFGEHPQGFTSGDPSNWIFHFDHAAEVYAELGVEVINCTISTALTKFRRADLREALQ